jgi:hypothetical protein
MRGVRTALVTSGLLMLGAGFAAAGGRVPTARDADNGEPAALVPPEPIRITEVRLDWSNPVPVREADGAPAGGIGEEAVGGREDRAVGGRLWGELPVRACPSHRSDRRTRPGRRLPVELMLAVV